MEGLPPVKAKVIIEMLGSPKAHLMKTLHDYIASLKERKDMTILSQDIAVAFFPQGVPMAAGLVAKAYTMAASSPTLNDSTGTDCPDGFVIIGDPL